MRRHETFTLFIEVLFYIRALNKLYMYIWVSLLHFVEASISANWCSFYRSQDNLFRSSTRSHVFS